MAFKIKDLMINVLPSGQAAFCGPGKTCAASCGRSVCTDLAHGSGVYAPADCGDTCGCTATCPTCTVTIFRTTDACGEHGPYGCAGSDPAASLKALSILKEQLKHQLSEVEKQQSAVEASLLPQTIEEADMLAQKLQEALDEVNALREKLRKPKPPGKKK